MASVSFDKSHVMGPYLLPALRATHSGKLSRCLTMKSLKPTTKQVCGKDLAMSLKGQIPVATLREINRNPLKAAHTECQ